MKIGEHLAKSWTTAYWHVLLRRTLYTYR